MTLYNWICLLGGPTIILAIGTYVVRKIGSRIKKSDQINESVQLGIQALLRDRLLQLYRECTEKGFATVSERENFANMYERYHNLGANGVMDDINSKFRNLPINSEE